MQAPDANSGRNAAPALPVMEPLVAGTDGNRELDVEIVVPALNEESRLRSTLQSIADYLAQQPYTGGIVVVDNGSCDRTTDLVLLNGHGSPRVPVRLIGCARPGKGAAVRRGILTSSAKYIGFCDADLATPIDVLDVMVPALERGARVVIGSRRCPGAQYAVKQPAARRVASRAFRLASCLFVPRLSDLHDTQCGFKFFEQAAARQLFSVSTAAGFAFDIEILALAYLADFDILEVPVRWEHREGSKLRVARDSRRVLDELLVMRRNLRAAVRDGFPSALVSTATPSRAVPSSVLAGDGGASDISTGVIAAA